MDEPRDFAISRITNTPGVAGTVFNLEATTGARMPKTPFDAFVFPEGQLPTPTNAEIVTVGTRVGDVLSAVTRKARGTLARNIQAGDILIAGVTAKTIEDLQALISAEGARAVEAESLLSFRSTANASAIEGLAADVLALEAQVQGLTGGSAPVVVTGGVNAGAEPTGATVKGEVTPVRADTEWWVEYGETLALGKASAKTLIKALTEAEREAAGGIEPPVSVSKALTSAGGALTAGTYYRIVAENVHGRTYGTTKQLGAMKPTVIANAPTNVSAAHITFNGTVNANGALTTLTWEYGPTNTYGKTASAGTVSGEGAEPIATTKTEAFSGTVHYRLKAENAKGTTNSPDYTVDVAAGAAAPVLKLQGDAETVEWKAVGAETGYTVAVSTAPAGAEGRVTGYVGIAKTADPQHFKPEPGVTYVNGGAGAVTPAPGQTVYVGVEANAPVAAPWSSEIAVTMPGSTEEPPLIGSAVLPGICINTAEKVQRDWTRSKEAGVVVGRFNSGNYTLAQAIGYAHAEGMKALYILPASGGTFSLAGVIAEYNGLSDANKLIWRETLLAIEVGNENWTEAEGNGAASTGGLRFTGLQMAQHFITCASEQEAAKLPIPLCLQTRLAPEHVSPSFMDSMEGCDHAALKKALEAKAWLPNGNYLTLHPYEGKMTNAQSAPTSMTNFSDGSTTWGSQRWMKEQWRVQKMVGFAPWAIISEYGVQSPSKSYSQIAEYITAAFTHCRQLEKGEVTTGLPDASYKPKLLALCWYDLYAWNGHEAGKEQFGIWINEGGMKPRTEGGIYAAFQAGAKSL